MVFVKLILMFCCLRDVTGKFAVDLQDKESVQLTSVELALIGSGSCTLAV